MSPLRPLLAAGLVAGGLALVAPGPAAAYDGVEADCADITDSDEETYSTTAASSPLSLMAVDRATARLRQEGRKPGQGVTVAVIDSGVATKADPVISVVERIDAGNLKPEPSEYHGTAVAGLIAGKPRARNAGGAVGIAPFAQVLDVQVYDVAAAVADDPENRPITVENVVAGLDAVIAARTRYDIGIVNISLVVPDDPQIQDRVAQLVDAGVVVVAPTGNRSDVLPPGVPPAFADGHVMGEDAGPYIHPASYPGVLGVNATPGGLGDVDPTQFVMENSRTDVAAPTANAVSYSLRGESCLLRIPATSFAAAEVSGALALLQSAYDEPVAASLRRLLTTANGRPDVPNTLVGAGEVQLDDALTRPMEVDAAGDDVGAGTVEQEPQVLQVPPEPEDVLRSTRENAVWWGLVAGGALLLALVLRPVLARRRRTPVARSTSARLR